MLSYVGGVRSRRKWTGGAADSRSGNLVSGCEKVRNRPVWSFGFQFVADFGRKSGHGFARIGTDFPRSMSIAIYAVYEHNFHLVRV